MPRLAVAFVVLNTLVVAGAARRGQPDHGALHAGHLAAHLPCWGTRRAHRGLAAACVPVVTSRPSWPPAAMIGLLLISAGIGMYPNLLISSTDPAYNLTVSNAASADNTLTVALVVARHRHALRAAVHGGRVLHLPRPDDRRAGRLLRTLATGRRPTDAARLTPATARLLDIAPGARPWLAASVVAGVLSALATLTIGVVTAMAIAGVFSDGQVLDDVWPLVALGVFLAGVRIGLIVAQETLAQRSSSRLRDGLRVAIGARLRELGPAWTAGERSGELTAAIGGGLDSLDAWLTSYRPARCPGGLRPGARPRPDPRPRSADRPRPAPDRTGARPPAGGHRRPRAGRDRSSSRRAAMDERLLPGDPARHRDAQGLRPKPRAGREHRGHQPRLRRIDDGGAPRGLPDRAGAGVGRRGRDGGRGRRGEPPAHG